MLSYENLLLEKNLRFKSIGLDLQKNKVPLSWFSNDSSTPKSILIVQFIHRLFFLYKIFYLFNLFITFVFFQNFVIVLMNIIHG